MSKKHKSEPAESSQDSPQSAAADLRDRLVNSGFSEADAFHTIEHIREIAAANLVERFERKLESQQEQLEKRFTYQDRWLAALDAKHKIRYDLLWGSALFIGGGLIGLIIQLAWRLLAPGD